MNKAEKMIGVGDGEDDSQNIIVTHLTIRQSIFFLVLKLICIEIIAASGMIFYYFLNTNGSAQIIREGISQFNPLPFFILLVLAKLALTVFVILEWLEEFYEIRPKEIIHKRGFLFRKEEKSKMEHLGSLTIKQGFLGRIFNYGTLRLFNWASEKDVSLYLIHNPRKYHKVLEDLLPEVDKSRVIFREHILDKDE